MLKRINLPWRLSLILVNWLQLNFFTSKLDSWVGPLLHAKRIYWVHWINGFRWGIYFMFLFTLLRWQIRKMDYILNMHINVNTNYFDCNTRQIAVGNLLLVFFPWSVLNRQILSRICFIDRACTWEIWYFSWYIDEFKLCGSISIHHILL